MNPYAQQLTAAMKMLGEYPDSVFVGQAVRYVGTAMTQTFCDVPKVKLLEFPVAEQFQLGFCTGLAMDGMLPISIYPRINFFLEATGQLVQHLDKIPLFSDYRPKVIIRTAIATPIPLDAGPQHLGDYSYALEQMLTMVKVVRLKEAEDIVPAYKAAMESNGSTILVEYSEKFLEGEK